METVDIENAQGEITRVPVHPLGVIFSALQAVNEKITAIQKTNNGQFKAQKIEDILNQLHPLFVENKIVVGSEIIERNSWQVTTKDGKIQFWVTATYRMRFTSTVDGSEFIVTEDGEGNDFSDKAGNKAKAYAMKGALQRLFTLPTADWNDGDHDKTKPVKRPSPQAKNPGAPKPEMITEQQVKKIHATCGSAMDYKIELAEFLNIDPEKVPSTKAMTKATATKFIDFLVKKAEACGYGKT